MRFIKITANLHFSTPCIYMYTVYEYVTKDLPSVKKNFENENTHYNTYSKMKGIFQPAHIFIKLYFFYGLGQLNRKGGSSFYICVFNVVHCSVVNNIFHLHGRCILMVWKFLTRFEVYSSLFSLTSYVYKVKVYTKVVLFITNLSLCSFTLLYVYYSCTHTLHIHIHITSNFKLSSSVCCGV